MHLRAYLHTLSIYIVFACICAAHPLPFLHQLWNDEPIMDRYLGCIDLPIEIFTDVRTFGGGRRQWFPFDSEVRSLLALCLLAPRLTERDHHIDLTLAPLPSVRTQGALECTFHAPLPPF